MATEQATDAGKKPAAKKSTKTRSSKKKDDMPKRAAKTGDPSAITPDGGAMPSEAVSGRVIRPDKALLAAFDTAQKTLGKKGVLVEKTDTLNAVLAVPAFVLRFLFHQNGLQLGRVYHTNGARASYKSTFTAEMANWFRDSGGMTGIAETEQKPNYDMWHAVTNYDEHTFQVNEVKGLENCTRAVIGLMKTIMKACPLRDAPVLYVVDSVASAQSEEVTEKIIQTGSADRRFPIEAQKIKDVLSAITTHALGWPFVWLLVNHVKPKTDQRGITTKSSPGGLSIGYKETMEIEFTRYAPTKPKLVDNPFDIRRATDDRAAGVQPGYKMEFVSLEMEKNSAGEDHKWIKVPTYLWYELARDPVSGETFKRQRFMFDWWSGTIMLLQGKNPRHDRVSQTLTIKERAHGGSRPVSYWCPELGMSSDDAVTMHELGRMIEQRPDVLHELNNEYNIRIRPLFDPGVNYAEQLDAKQHLVRDHERASRIAHAQRTGGGDLLPVADVDPSVAVDVAAAFADDEDDDQWEAVA